MLTGIDYAIFCGLLLISAFIGIFYAWKDRNEKDVDAYLVGKGQMSPIPVAISLCVSYISGLMMVGIPTQIYYYGVILVWYSVVYVVGPWITGIYYIPLFFRLKIISVYEILEIRYGKYSRMCASASVIVLMVIYMGLVTYIPCLSLSAVSTISIRLSIVITCAVCTFYTTLGGIKAVIWTDVVQAGVMVFGMLTVIVSGTNHVGGFSNVTAALARSDRLNFAEWSFDPRLRYSTWSILIGLPVVWTMMSAINQPMVQRYLSCKNVQQARVAVWMFLVPQQVFFWLALLTGIVMSAYFEHCDPLRSGAIQFPDQSLAYMVVNLFQSTPGLAGIFIAGVYSGTLSTISSGINALSAVILSDFVVARIPSLKSKSLVISKFLVFVLGIIVMCVTFFVKAMGKMVIDILLTMFGSIGGPLMAVYTMGVFMPRTNEKGAVAGQIIATVICFWVSVGQVIYPPPMKYLQIRPIAVDGCPAPNEVDQFINTTSHSILNQTLTTELGSGSITSSALVTGLPVLITPERPPIADSLYLLSNNYIGLLGFLVCLFVGVVVSGITGFEDPNFANTDIFTPIIDNKVLPQRVRQWFRLGVPMRQKVRSEESDSVDEKITGKESKL